MLFFGLLKRQKKPKSKRQAEHQFAQLSDVDLADMGLKRYHLETFLQK